MLAKLEYTNKMSSVWYQSYAMAERLIYHTVHILQMDILEINRLSTCYRLLA